MKSVNNEIKDRLKPSSPTFSKPYRVPFNVWLWTIPVLWTVFIGLAFWWNTVQIDHTVRQLARVAALSLYEQDILYRQWSAMHGSTYISIDQNTRPNPYLHVPKRDIVTTAGDTLTLINPACMTSQVFELGKELYNQRSHIASLKPLRPENAPDDWERRALESFELGITEVSSIETLEGELYLRFMGPLKTSASCLKCHAAQGYTEGDIRGGISVAVLLKDYEANVHPLLKAELIVHTSIWVLGLLLYSIGSIQVLRRRKERALAEEALRTSEKQLRGLYKSMKDAYVAVTLDGAIREFNEAYCLMLGYDKQELLRLTYNDITPERWHAYEADIVKNQVFLNGYSEIFQKEYCRKDGTLFPVELRAFLIRNDSGTPTGMWAIVRDITERQKSEQALHASEERFRRIFEESPFGITIASPDFKFLDANPAFCRMIGYTRDELLIRTFAEITPPSRVDRDRENVLALKQGTIKEYKTEKQYLKKNGDLFWGNLQTSAIRDQEGNVLRYVALVEDITERKLAEEALKKSEQHNKVIAEITTDYVFIVDVDHQHNLKLRWASANLTQITGRTLDDVATSDLWRKIIHPEDVGMFFNFVTQILTTAQSGELECRSFTKFDIERWIHLFVRPETDAHNQVCTIIGAVKDITERKRTEEALRKSEEHFRTVIENASVGACLVGLDYKFISVNHTMCEMLGCSEEELRTRTFNDVTYEEDKKIGTENVRQLLAGTTNRFIIEKRYIHKDGHFIWGLVSSSLLRDRTGKPQYFVTHVQDISDRKRTETALTESEERYRRLVEFSPDPIAVHQQGKFVYANPAAVKLLGAADVSQVFGLSVFSIIHPDSIEIVRQRVKMATLERKALPPLEEKLIRMDGTVVEVEVTSIPIIYEGNPATQVVVRDITEQKKLQHQILQTQKIQSIGTLAGGIAHDFNNILGIILGYAALLDQRRMQEKKHAESVAAITQAAERGASLVRQILTFARKTDVAFHPINILGLIRELLSMLRQTFPKTILFTETYASELPEINADRTQIHQALLNLCVNARDAMPNGGSITIQGEQWSKERTRELFPAADKNSYVCISITDTGVGMDEATRLRAFDPFFTTKEKGKGTGLGLSVVYGIIQSYHGFITVTSTIGSGTTFILLFPASETAGTISEKTIPAEVLLPGGTETILVVEDEELLMDMVVVMLESYGYTVLSAPDGESAIEIFARRSNEIALVLSDLGLPKMSGVEEFRKLQKIKPDVKVVLASGFFEPSIKQELQEAGAKGFIQKPYNNEQILVKIREVLDDKS